MTTTTPAPAPVAPAPKPARSAARPTPPRASLAALAARLAGTLDTSVTRLLNGNDRDVDRTTTVQIKEVGSTKVDVPDEAKKKMS